MKGKGICTQTTLDPGGETAGLFRILSHHAGSLAGKRGIRVFLVGGFVRDLLEGKVLPVEWDLVVFGGGPSGALTFARDLARSLGFGEPVAFPRFGTFLVVGEGLQVEIADARLRRGWHPDSGDPLLDDALTRDFTLNALYVELAGPCDGEEIRVLDPCGQGLDDLAGRVLRTPVPSGITFSEDPLRIFRAARFCSTKNYRLDPSLGRAAVGTRDQVSRIAPERIFSEMNAILMSPKPSRGLEPLVRWGVLENILPEVQGMAGFRQESPWHFPDLLRHSLRVVDWCRPDLALRWAAILHDCGKPASRVAGTEGDSFHGHERAGAELARKALKRLRAGKKFTREVSELVGLHMVFFTDEWSDRAVRRFIQRAGEHLDKLLDLVEADSASLKRRKEKLAALAGLRERVAAMREKIPAPDSPLGGHEIMDLVGAGPGPWVGEAKGLLSEAAAEGKIGDEKTAREFLLKWWKEGGHRLH